MGANWSEAQREKRFGRRTCIVDPCTRSFIPYYAEQEACSQPCGTRLAWRRGKFTHRDTSKAYLGGRKSAKTKRAAAIRRVVASMGGEAVTDRDYRLYRLGWEHCLVTNERRWERQRARAARHAPSRVVSSQVEAPMQESSPWTPPQAGGSSSSPPSDPCSD